MVGLPPDAMARFRNDGFLVIRDLLDANTLVPAFMQDFGNRLSEIADTMVREGRLPTPCPHEDFDQRVQWLYRESKDIFAQNLNISIPPTAGLPEDTPVFLPESVFDAIRDPALLDVLESIIGPEISANPIQHVRIKPPQTLVDASAAGTVNASVGISPKNGLVSRTPWHQDNAVVTPDADDTEMVTVWFPLTSATEERGCLQVIPGSHHEGLRDHVQETTNREFTVHKLPDIEPVTLPMEPGDVLLLHRRTCHASLPNQGDEVRWSLDLRYHPTGMPSGRDVLPSFVVRSRKDPTSEIRDVEDWRAGWHAAIAALAATPPNEAKTRWA